MCDIRLFRSARMDYETAEMIWKSPYNDEMILNNAAYHLQLTVEKVLKGAFSSCSHSTALISRPRMYCQYPLYIFSPRHSARFRKLRYCLSVIKSSLVIGAVK